jgi:hypothetical protein
MSVRDLTCDHCSGNLATHGRVTVRQEPGFSFTPAESVTYTALCGKCGFEAKYAPETELARWDIIGGFSMKPINLLRFVFSTCADAQKLDILTHLEARLGALCVLNTTRRRIPVAFQRLFVRIVVLANVETDRAQEVGQGDISTEWEKFPYQPE